MLLWTLALAALQTGASITPSTPMYDRADQWRCSPTTARMCSSEGCRDSAPSIWVDLDFTKRTYARCDKQGCDTRAATVSSGGVVTSVTLAGGTFLKSLNDGSEFIDVASSSTTAFINTGHCRPLKVETSSATKPVVRSAALPFADYKTFRCRFEVGTAQDISTYGRGDVMTDARGFDEEIVFDSIDREKGTARMIGNVGSADLAVIGDSDTLSLVEITPSGNVMVTAILSALRRTEGTSDVFQAVHSRTMTLLQQANASQFVGECRGLLP